jgi:hypothetical protein
MRENVLAVMALMVSCAETEPDKADDPIGLLNLIAESYCAHLETCGVSAPDFIYGRCTETQQSEESATRLREDIKRGFAVWSQEEAERCLQAIAEDTCPIEPKLLPNRALSIDLDLDDAKACIGVLAYPQPGVSSHP